ncbi:MAG: beta-galactosidase [Bryobacterales bacterium]|nr:beta-galactosidase [Bryobacterales bacterium]
MYNILVCLMASGLAYGAEIALPAASFERAGTVHAAYRTGQLASGSGELTIRWTDAYGRLIENRRIEVKLNGENQIGFTLDLGRAAAMRNQLTARFLFDGVNRRGQADHREEEAKAEFIARPTNRSWWDYEIIMWQHRTPDQVAALKTIGISGGQWVGRNRSLPDFLLNNDLRWYAENIATDFYSEYHRYFPDRRNDWKFLEAREQYKKDRSSKEPFKRHPSLNDPYWLALIHDRLVETAKYYAPYRPFFYSLGDESGIANLAAFWDFDFSDESLVPMRRWLRERYATLRALNEQWGTEFRDWDAVIPPTTDEAMKREGENFSGWSDFKEWMDVAFASALKMGADAIHSVDPEAYIGIGGGQMPGWGGYDYSRLTESLNAIEPYDIGNNIEIIRSLNPKMAVLTTSFATGPWEKHRVWYELLHGNRGLILWDDKSAFIGGDNAIGPRGKETAPYYEELRGGLGALLINSRRVADPIAIHYSQPSMRIEWMLARRPKGGDWVLRNSSTEYRDSDFLRLRESYCRLIEDEGLQYNFVSYRQMERGELARGGYRVLILPHSTAMSEAEARAAREFVEGGGMLIADGEPAAFDEHCRRLPKSWLADLFEQKTGRAVLLKADVLNYHRDRVVGREGEVKRVMGELLGRAGIKPEFAVTGSSGNPVTGVETHVFRNGGVRLVALLTNPELRIDELGPPEFKSNDRFAKPVTVRLALPGERFVYDVRRAKALGRQREVSVTLDPYEPTILAVAAEEIPAMQVAAPARVRLGGSVEVGIRFATTTPAENHALHIDVVNPDGRIVPFYSGNLLAHGGTAAKRVALALNDPPGRWEARVKDLLSGQSKTVAFEVY